ncbi:hypothetical protein ACCO45_011518 [Purpureocillium lilacinum]|uniref:Uncharacterized protein n=1 Tax=Purpureocillium lilacinum TaxID=33203 RepID=A0ACC4DBM5_PURLI
MADSDLQLLHAAWLAMRQDVPRVRSRRSLSPNGAAGRSPNAGRARPGGAGWLDDKSLTHHVATEHEYPHGFRARLSGTGVSRDLPVVCRTRDGFRLVRVALPRQQVSVLARIGTPDLARPIGKGPTATIRAFRLAINVKDLARDDSCLAVWGLGWFIRAPPEPSVSSESRSLCSWPHVDIAVTAARRRGWVSVPNSSRHTLRTTCLHSPHPGHPSNPCPHPSRRFRRGRRRRRQHPDVPGPPRISPGLYITRETTWARLPASCECVNQARPYGTAGRARASRSARLSCSRPAPKRLPASSCQVMSLWGMNGAPLPARLTRHPGPGLRTAGPGASCHRQGNPHLCSATTTTSPTLRQELPGRGLPAMGGNLPANVSLAWTGDSARSATAPARLSQHRGRGAGPHHSIVFLVDAGAGVVFHGSLVPYPDAKPVRTGRHAVGFFRQGLGA